MSPARITTPPELVEGPRRGRLHTPTPPGLSQREEDPTRLGEIAAPAGSHRSVRRTAPYSGGGSSWLLWVRRGALVASEANLFEALRQAQGAFRAAQPLASPYDLGNTPPEPGSKPPEPGSKPPEPGSKPPEPGSKPPEPGSTPPEPGSTPPELVEGPRRGWPLRRRGSLCS